MTQDVDLLIRSTAPNRLKLGALRRALGNLDETISSELAPVRTLLGEELPIDVIFDHLPGRLSFAAIKARSTLIQLGSSRLRVAALEDVVRSKEAADRPKDRAQLPVLRETLRVLEALKKGPR